MTDRTRDRIGRGVVVTLILALLGIYMTVPALAVAVVSICGGLFIAFVELPVRDGRR